MADEMKTTSVMTAEALLEHWQGHRRLTRRTIEAFPDEKLFCYSVEGMRSFGEMACELLRMTIPIASGLITGKWEELNVEKPITKVEILSQWEDQTKQLDEIFPSIPAHKFGEVSTAFGQWNMPGINMVLYGIDNEIHHRGQGFVYLRSLGIEPPPFWERK
jgi:uncharacterized damage-inducible protein DinB